MNLYTSVIDALQIKENELRVSVVGASSALCSQLLFTRTLTTFNPVARPIKSQNSRYEGLPGEYPCRSCSFRIGHHRVYWSATSMFQIYFLCDMWWWKRSAEIKRKSYTSPSKWSELIGIQLPGLGGGVEPRPQHFKHCPFTVDWAKASEGSLGGNSREQQSELRCKGQYTESTLWNWTLMSLGNIWHSDSAIREPPGWCYRSLM